MRLKKGTFLQFAKRAWKDGKKIIVYGAGVIGQTAAPYWLREYRLEQRILCYVDADPNKQGQTVQVGPRDVPIRPLSALDEESGYILLVTVSAFEPVVQALEQIPGTKNVEAYFLPVMLLNIARAPKKSGVVQTSETPLIPKIIHYTWFSGEPIPESLQLCIDSWKKFCPDYEIIRWDTDNYDIHKSPYMEQAYAHKKWGFVSDYARLDFLYQYGGVFMDTDVELIHNLDCFLYQPAFSGTEKWGIVSSAVLGACPGNPVIRSLLDYRKDFSFMNADGSLNLTSSGTYDTIPLVERGLKVNGETQVIADGQMVVYSSDFFQPYDYTSGETNLTQNTYAIHHFDGGWLSEDERRRRAETRKHYQSFLSRLEA